MPTIPELIERVPHDGQHDVGVPLESCHRCALDAKMAESVERWRKLGRNLYADELEACLLQAQPVELSAEDVGKCVTETWRAIGLVSGPTWNMDMAERLNSILREKGSTAELKRK
jgi:hypothetical protein